VESFVPLAEDDVLVAAAADRLDDGPSSASCTMSGGGTCGNAAEMRIASAPDAEPRLQGSVLLTVLPCCPDEQDADRDGKQHEEQCERDLSDEIYRRQSGTEAPRIPGFGGNDVLCARPRHSYLRADHVGSRA
jgi:hypothetical protein